MGIMVLNDVKVKAGRLATGTYTPDGLVPFRGDPFGYKGDAVYPPTGDAFNIVSKGDGHPMASFHNLATQQYIPAVAQTKPGAVQSTVGRMSGGNFPKVQPHEHGSVLVKKKLTVVRMTGGPKKSHNTAMNPKKQPPQPKQRVYPARAGERSIAASFTSHQRLLSDPQFRPHGAASRWATVKRGAAG